MLKTTRVVIVTTFSVVWQLPLLVASGTNNWKTKNVPVGSTFANWVSMSVEIVEAVEHMDDIDEDIFKEDIL